ncbi:hypothetical protein EGT67_20515 [Prescottella agglutinans]|uniref:Signal transduction histidine kinase subgroup 3 dimerisation and phosphoacceptor domain-containing protein n=1 Tax=Prescottella agglutinans TaxID=1644129 RepID=A0A3S3AGT4_9NOCA|nr:hypothetical protein [Prescottella agglutinans]RVW07813.1 hypothetical protein EGT67_20515 [Prescottella agglutinans]
MRRPFPRPTRVGGSAAVTRWSWILTAPFAVTVMGSYYTARGPADWPTYFGVAVMVHLIMGVGLLIAWLTVLRPNRTRAQPAVAIAVFALLGATRPFLLDALIAVQGLPTDPRNMGVRLIINVTTGIVALSLIAILVDSVREHDAVMARLRAARAALDEQRRVDEEYLAGLGRRCADDLAARIDAALAHTDRVSVDAERDARLLRAISEDIVRPMSHALFDDATPPPEPTPPLPALTRRERLLGVLQAVRPAPLTLPALLYTVVILTFLLTSYGFRETVLQVSASLAVCVFGSWVVQRTAPRIPSAGRRVGVMALAYSAVAGVTAGVFWIILGGSGFPPAFVVPGVAFYPLAALAMCLIAAANEQREVEERQLADTLGDRSRRAAEVHGRVIGARRRLAHVLHSSVQGELVAAALAMRVAPAAVDVSVGEIVDRLLREVARGEQQPTERSDARAQITELIGMWSAAVPIRTDIDEQVWSLLSASPARLEHAVDVLSEGFTNAIRHGRGGPLHMRMSVDPRTSLICIGIRSPGQVARDRGDGLGLATLSSRVGSADLVEEPGSVLLSVRLD